MCLFQKKYELRSQQQEPNVEPLVLTLEIGYPHKANSNVKWGKTNTSITRANKNVSNLVIGFEIHLTYGNLRLIQVVHTNITTKDYVRMVNNCCCFK